MSIKINKVDQFFIDHESKITKSMLAISIGIFATMYPDLAMASTENANDLLADSKADDLITKIEGTMGGKGGKILTVLAIIGIVGIGAINKAAMYGAAGTVVVLKGGTAAANKLFAMLF